MTDLSETAHGQAVRLILLVIALINGSAPLLIALGIISPFWFAAVFEDLSIESLQVAIAIAFIFIFLLGTLLVRVSGTFWLVSGLRTLVIGLLTCAIIYVLTPRTSPAELPGKSTQSCCYQLKSDADQNAVFVECHV